MILDKLVEKKNIFIFIDQRIHRLGVSLSEIGGHLRDPSVSRKKKKALLRGQKQIKGRIKELKNLKGVLAEGRLRSESKRMWLQNFKDGLIDERKRQRSSSEFVHKGEDDAVQ